MSVVDFTFDQSKVTKYFKSKRRDLLKNITKEWRLAGHDFIRIITSKWYSGRWGDDTGLNRQTGKLARSWFTNTIGNFKIGVVTIVYSNAGYGEYHDASYTPKSSPRKVPVRTYVVRDFNDKHIGKMLFLQALKQAVRETP